MKSSIQSVFSFLFFSFFGCVRSSLLCEGFLLVAQAAAALHGSVRASLVAEHRL